MVHALPALTDAQRALPELRCDWVVEEAFAEIPGWHPTVERVIPVSLRRWRKHPWRAWRSGEWGGFREELREHYYDVVLDAQGLLKSALLSLQAHGLRHGLDKNSAREPLAARFYQYRHSVPRGEHAITRLRRLFAAALNYAAPLDEPLDYGLPRGVQTTLMSPRPTLIFFHGTTWETKHWPEAYWAELALLAARTGFQVRLPWGNEAEKQRAARLAKQHSLIIQMPATTLAGMAAELSSAVAVVGVDTGLVHLAAALGVPALSLYGSTEPGLTGSLGPGQQHLQADFPCAPCFRRHCDYAGTSAVQPACYATLPPSLVWERLLNLIAAHKNTP